MLGINKGQFAGIMLSFLLTSGSLANPVLGNVAAGNVSIQQTPNTTTINQSSQQAIINWQSFNIGSQQATHFNQPTGGIALNRISPTQGASQIFGVLTATGRIILINPAGIYFGPGAYVNVGGMIATTSNITDKNFLSGNYIFNQPSPYANASIINAGTIIAAQHGMIALVGQNVTNDGKIQANLGKVVLASGDAFTVNFSGDGMINFALDSTPSPRSGRVSNTGSLIADGGQILVTAKQASGVLDNVINLEGVVQAKSVYKQNGEIIISGDPNAGVVRVAANINASGKKSGEKGGTVNITGHNILIDSPALIDVSGDAGGGKIHIGGNYQGLGPLPNANAVVMASNARLQADALTTGNGGEIILWSNDYTNASGVMTARGGSVSGDGGLIETSSHNILNTSNMLVDLSAPHGKTGLWLLDPFDVTISGAATAGGTFGGGNPNIFTPTATANILNTDINTNLATANVTITTSGAGADAGNITVNAPITWASANTLLLQADNNIIINSAISGLNGSLNLSAVNAAGSITTGAGGTVNVANFNLLQGRWLQTSAVLPAFNVSNNFQINSGVIPVASAEFIRSASATGDGTLANPYILTDIYGVQGMGSSTNTVDLNYRLGSNIDASGTINWNGGLGFVPIGDDNLNKFTGTLNGLGNTISNLYINRPASAVFVALISNLVASSVITDVSLSNVNITGPGDTAPLVGINQGGLIQATIAGGITITGVVNTVTNGPFYGGLVGNSSGTITATALGNLVVDTDIISATTGNSFLGGIVGLNGGSVTNAIYTGNITAPAADAVGGIVGQSNNVTNSQVIGSTIIGRSSVGGLVGIQGSTGSITSTGAGLVSVSGSVSGTGTGIGGLVGRNDGTITPAAQGNILVTATVTGNGATSVGGVAGINSAGTGVISNVQYTGPLVSGTNANQIGGLVGNLIGTLSNSFVTGNVSGGSNVGGLIGVSQLGSSFTSTGAGLVSMSGNVTGSGNSIGGLVGFSQSNISPASQGFMLMTGSVTGTGAAGSLNLGGIAGLAANTLFSNLTYAGPLVSGTNYTNVGGIAGQMNNFTSFSNNIVTGNVSGGSAVGGLVGLITNGATSGISSTASGLTTVSGNVTGSGNQIGGLVGINNKSITPGGIDFVTFTGTVSGTGAAGSTSLGGLIGESDAGTLSNLRYISNPVSNTNYDNVGGLVGFLNGSGTTVTDSFATVNVTGRNNVGGLVGRMDVATVLSSTALNNLRATGNVSGAGNFIGGLVGLNVGGNILATAQGFIVATGQVTGTGAVGSTGIGGMLGGNSGAISNLSYTSNPINAPNYNDVGGLIGQNSTFASITDSFATVNVTGRDNVGGLIGNNNNGLGAITSTGTGLMFASGNVSGRNNVGGLFGSNASPISATALNSISASGIVTGSGNNIGGLIGLNNGTISPGSQGFIVSTSSVSGTGAAGSTGLGGIFGSNSGTVSNLTNTIAISSLTYDQVGGIAGNNTGIMSNLYNSANITGRSSVGGIAGRQANPGSINTSYNTADITGVTGSVGGIVGTMTGSTNTINRVYNLGDVFNSGTSPAPSGFGGLVGTAAAGSVITNSYNSGYVNATIGGQIGTTVGGIVGSLTSGTLGFTYNTGFIVGASGTGGLIGVATSPTFSGTNYFNSQTSGQSVGASNLSNANLISSTTSAMQLQATYTGWNFATIWNIVNNVSYPWLQAFYTTTPRIVTATSSAAGGTETAMHVNNVLRDIVRTGANGQSYFLEGNNLVSGINSSIADGDSLFLFFNQFAPTVSNAVAFAPIGTQMGFSNSLTLNTNFLTVGLLTSTGSYSNAQINSIVGGDPHALFTVAGNTLTMNSGKSFALTAPTTYVTDSIDTSGGGGVNLAGTIDGGGNPFTINTDNTSTITGILTNMSSFTKAGTGTLTLSGANTFTGSTSILGGTLSISADNNLGTAPGVATPGHLILDGGTLATTATFTLNANRGINLGAGNGTFSIGAGTNLTYGGVIAGAGDLIKSGTGNLVLNNVNTYAGATNITAGGIVLGTNNALPTSTDLTNDGLLSLNNFSQQVASLNGTGSVSNGGGTTSTFTVASAGTDTFSGIISGNLALTKINTGVLILSGANTYSGDTTISAGTLRYGNVNAIPSGPGAGNVIVNGTLDLASFSPTVNGLSGSGIVDISTGSNDTFSVGANNATSTFSGVLQNSTGTLNLLKTGAGTLTLSGANTYSGITTVNGGTLIVANATGLGSVAGGTFVNNAILTIAGVNVGNEAIFLDNSTLRGTGTAGLAGDVTLADNSTDTIDAVGNFTISGNINGNTADNATLILSGAGTLNITGGIGTGTGLSNIVYNVPLNLGAASVMTATTININNGITGGNNLTLNSNVINLSGPISVNNLSINGTGANNTFLLNTGGTQTWNLTGGDAGTVGNSGIAGAGTFSNIQNITGGSGNDTYALNGGSLSGNVNDLGGSNTLIGDNVANVWTITGSNNFSVNGVAGLISGVQNLTGGTANNTYIFTDGASFTGAINGGSLAGTTTLDYSAYTTPITITLAANKFNGTTVDSFGNIITSYININNLIGNGSASRLILTDAQLAQAVSTGPLSGFIGDPVFWSGFSVFFPSSGPFITGPLVSPIIQQPESGGEDTSVNFNSSVEENMNSLISEAEIMFDTSLSGLKINPYCYQAN